MRVLRGALGLGASVVAIVAGGCGLDDLSSNVKADGGAEGGAASSSTSSSSGGDGGAGPCASGAQRYCDDFDGRTAPASSVFTVDTSNGGTIAIEPGDAVSAPNALVVKTPPSPANAATSTLNATTSLVGNHARVEVMVKLSPAGGPFGAGQTCRFLVVAATAGFGLELGAAGPQIHYVIPGTPPTEVTTPLTPFPFDRWVKLVVDVVFDGGSNGSVQVDVDGKTLYQLGKTRTAIIGSAGLGVGVGLLASAGAPACTVRYDDVKIF